VKLGDCLYYVTGGGGHCAGIVTSITDLTVAFDHAWDLERSVDLHTLKLRRANWSRHHVVLMDPIDLPSATGSPQPNAAGLAAQEVPGPARPSGAPVAGTDDPVRYPQQPSNRARRRSR
jgi:hypothetical protein